ncbi:MAG: hypothetical protein LIP05_03515 [Tannerellaceae bacterium]|nr:hypothetical protein [Tannerellaceae bacterium]
MQGILFALYPIDELAADVTIPHAPSRFSGITLAHNTYSEEEVAEIMAAVEKLGGTIIKSPQKHPGVDIADTLPTPTDTFLK